MKPRWIVGAAVLIGALGAGLWLGRGTYTSAQIGTSYVAKQTCSCLFVVRRSAEACSRDYEAQGIERLTVQPAASGVTVSALGGLLSATAEFEAGFGCHLVN